MFQAIKNKLFQLLRSFRSRWKLWIFFVVAVIGLGLWQYRRTQAAKPEYQTEHPAYRTLVKTLEVSGVVDAKEKARMRFLAGGKVTYLGAQEGDTVKKNQTLAIIDQTTLQKQLQQDLNTFMQERLDWDQTNVDVYKDTYTTDEERTREKAQLGLNNEVLDVEIRNIAINNSRLYAPFSGVLTTSPTNVTGVQLLSSDYFDIVNPQTLIFRAEVDEADIATVAVGQSASLNLDAYPDDELETTVNYIAFTSSQTASGTVFLVEFPLNEATPSGQLTSADLNYFRLGMNGDIAIELARKENVLSIPFIAIKERDDKTFVDVKTGDNTLAEKEITPGLETDEYIEVIDGLAENDLVVIPE